MIDVGISEYRVATYPHILSSRGMGSCVGICLHDPVIKIGGMAHVLLPDSSIGKDEINPGKFADTAVNALLHDMIGEGSQIKNIKAKLVGGASMFSATNSGSDKLFSMGPKNVAAAKNILAKKGIKLEGEDTGGSHGRSIEFHAGTGKVIVKTMVSINEL